MTAPLSADQQARLDRIEAAPEAEEACRMQVAAAIHRTLAKQVATGYVSPTQIEAAADAAIAVLRGPSVADEALRRVEELAEELTEDSRDAMRRSDGARERGDRVMQSVNVRHARVAKHAAEQIRAALNGGELGGS